MKLCAFKSPGSLCPQLKGPPDENEKEERGRKVGKERKPERAL